MRYGDAFLDIHRCTLRSCAPAYGRCASVEAIGRWHGAKTRSTSGSGSEPMPSMTGSSGRPELYPFQLGRLLEGLFLKGFLAAKFFVHIFKRMPRGHGQLFSLIS